MKIYLASVNLADKESPRPIPCRLFSFWELRSNLFNAYDCFKYLSELDKNDPYLKKYENLSGGNVSGE